MLVFVTPPIDPKVKVIPSLLLAVPLIPALTVVELDAASGVGPNVAVCVRLTDGLVALPVTVPDVAEAVALSTTPVTVPLVITKRTAGMVVVFCVPTAVAFWAGAQNEGTIKALKTGVAAVLQRH